VKLEWILRHGYCGAKLRLYPAIIRKASDKHRGTEEK